MASKRRKAINHTIVTGYAQMWPRKVFDLKAGPRNKLFIKDEGSLAEPGVYILYRDDHPYYVGKTTGPLWHRIWNHANQPRDKWYNFWNFFSAFTVPNTHHLAQVEGILIAAMPTANSANPMIRKIRLPIQAIKALRREAIQVE